MRLPDPGTSRALILGTSRFRHPDLPELPTVVEGVAAMARVMTDVQGTSLPHEHTLSVLNEGSLAIVGDHLETFSSSARDTLIVYYAGHGVLGADGELYLALVDTQVDRLPWTAVPISALKRLIAASPAENRVLILDCCFSGRAIETMTEMQSALSSQTVISGAYMGLVRMRTCRVGSPRRSHITRLRPTVREPFNVRTARPFASSIVIVTPPVGALFSQ